jgi:ESS family glutamate:Na+ symporter
MTEDPILLPALESATLGFLVYLLGALITRRIGFLRDFNIPEPVTGGLLAALVTLGIHAVWGRPVLFDLTIRDYLLIVFFSGIGLNARLSDLRRGGVPLLVLLAVTIALVFAQNVLGLLTALGFGLPAQAGLLLGSVSLLGGHGTTIAWAPEIKAATGLSGAAELGVASATLGLVVGALLGGPVAQWLIARYRLTTGEAAVPAPAGADLGLEFADERQTSLTPVDLMRTLFVLHAVLLAGLALQDLIAAAGLRLPDFVPCMLVAILVGNLLPVLLPRLPQVPRSPALSLVTDFALGGFLAMSLMSLQLWTLQGLGLLMAVSILAQTLLALAFVWFAIFRLMGRNYFAAVLSAGFTGFALGATPTAIANMNAVTKAHGPAPLAFVILPLISAFFLDLVNAAVIQLFLAF